MKKRVVVGAGISGLTAAWHLKKQFPEDELLILEASSRCGGFIQTIKKEGFLFELGPRSCRLGSDGQKTLRLAEELGLKSSILFASPSAKNRFLLRDGALEPAFSGLPRAALPALWRDLFANPLKQDCSVEEFFSQHVSKKFVRHFIDPLVSGIYAGDPAKLSMQLAFPTLWQWQSEHGSLLKGYFRSPKQPASPPLFSFTEGMQTLTDALTEKLSPHIRLQTRVVDISPKGELILESGEVLSADQTVLTIPLKNLQLPKIDYASVAIVLFGYRHPVLKREGFGYLVPSNENASILGTVFDSCVFPEQGEGTRFSVMIGGVRMPHLVDLADQELETIAREALRRHLDIQCAPDVVHVHRAYRAIPQYPVGFAGSQTAALARLKAAYPSLILSGTLFHGVSINDCVAVNAEKIYSES